MIAALLVLLLWAALIFVAFCVCASAGRADRRIEGMRRTPGGWRNG
jgi:hypothetical protein